MKGKIMNRIDMHTHYFPPAYYAMLQKRGMTVLDGGMPVPEWSPEKHLQNMETLSVSLACLSVSSPHLHMGDAAEASETARAFLSVLSDRLLGIPQVFPDLAGLDIEKSLAGLYYDLAGVSMPKQFADLKKNVSTDHLLYGSDGTFTPMPLCKKLADDMEHTLTETEKERIYRENAIKLLGL